MSDKTENVTAAQTVAKPQENTTTDANPQTTSVDQAQTTSEAPAEAPKKVNRRGVAGARGVQRLKFSHELAQQNGLFLGQLFSVELGSMLIGEEKSGMPSFNGMEIPKIVFTFTSNEEDLTKRHYQTVSFNAVESNALTIPGAKDEWKVNNVFDWFKHILDVFVFKGRALTDAEAEALSLSFEDFDEAGDYAPVDVEVVVAAWKTLFENVSTLLNQNADGKPAFKTKDGKAIHLWMKLLRYTKHKVKSWMPVSNGDLAFPTFIGEGVIEIFRQNAKPSIRLDIVKEAIIPMNIEKAKAPNLAGSGIPSMPGMPGDGGGNFGGSMGGINLNTDTGDDMPF